MKNRIPLLLTCLLFLFNIPLSSALNYQSLTDTRGNTIQAHIWKVVGNDVFIEVPSGRKFRVTMQMFSPQSQAVLQQIANPVPAAPVTTAPSFGVTPAPAPPPPPAFSAPAPAPGVPSVASVPFSGTSTPPATPPSSFGARSPAVGPVIDTSVAIYPNAAVLLKVNGDKITSSPFVQAIKSQMKSPGAPASPSSILFGLSDEDLTSIAVSLTSFEGLDFEKLSKSGPEALKQLPPNVKFAVAVSFSKPIDMAVARKEMMEGVDVPLTFSEYGGATLVPMPEGAGELPPNYGAAIKNQGAGSIFIVGELPHLRGVLDGSIQPGTLASSQEDFALSINVPPALMEQLAAGSAENPIMAAMMVPLKQMNKITLGMTFNQAANINLAAHFSDPAVAQQLSAMLAPMVAGFTSKPDTPPFLKQLAITNSSNQLNAAMAIQAQDAMGLAPMLLGGLGGPGGPGMEDFPEGEDSFSLEPSGSSPGAPGLPPPTTAVPFSGSSSASTPSPAAPPFGSPANSTTGADVPPSAPSSGTNPFAN